MLFLTLTNPKVTGVAPWLRLVRETPSHAAGYPTPADRPACRTPKDSAELLRSLEREEVEVFVALFLDAQHKVIGRCEVSRGVVDAALVHPREVFRLAIALGASAVIVGHNHPSGDPTPSEPDKLVTRQLVAAGNLLDIKVHDHIIIGAAGRYTSLAEQGYL